MKNAKLHPMLAAALSGLDLDLETELNRFRQSKQGSGQGTKAATAVYSLPASAPPPRHTPTAPPDPELGFEEDWLDPDALVPDAVQSPPVPSQLPSQPSSQPLPPSALHLPPLDLAAMLGSADATSISSRPEHHRLSEASSFVESSFAESSFAWSPEQMPEDYLASTEVLLNSLADAPPELPRRSRLAPPSSFPLALSLGLTSLVLGGGVTALFFLSRPGTQAARQSTPVVTTTPSPNSAAGGVPTAANLAQVEFQNLDQTSLSVLPPGSPVPQSTTKAGMVRVVILNGDAKLLSPLQKLVPGAFLEPTAQGTKIQLGLYTDVRQAEAVVADLRQQGYPAEIEHP